MPTIRGADTRTITSTNGLGQATTYIFNLSNERLRRVTDPLGRAVSYDYDGSGRVTRITQPEGNYTQLTYDGRGNVTETRKVAKPGSGLADIVPARPIRQAAPTR